jgi:hypothetical protein
MDKLIIEPLDQGKLLKLMRLPGDVHFMVVQQESLGIEKRQIHSLVGLVHRNGGNFSDGIQLIPEIALICLVSREKWRTIVCSIS